MTNFTDWRFSPGKSASGTHSIDSLLGPNWSVRFEGENNPLPPAETSSTVCLQINGAVSKVNKKFISHLTRAQLTPPAAATVQVSHALPAVRFSCLLRGLGVSLQDGTAAGNGFLCAPF